MRGLLRKSSLQVLRMPQLSPTMSAGYIRKWYAEEGGMRRAYELIVDVQPDQLTKVSEDRAHFLEIEVQEDLFLAKRLVSANQLTKVNTPVALMCEDEGDFRLCKEITVSSQPSVLSS